MAHNAVVYTMGRIKHLLTSTTFPDAPCFREVLEFAYEELLPLEEITERIFWSGSSTLDLEIETTVWRLDDVIEQIVSLRWPDDRDGGVDFSTALLDLKQEIQSSIKALKEYIEEDNHPLPDEEEDDVISSRIGVCGNKSEMVGLSDKIRELKKKLTSRGTHSGPGVVSILGMPGIGKTTLAKKTFEDPEIMQHFDCRVWLKVGKNCQLNDIPRRVLAELDPGRILEGGDEDSVRRCFSESLKGKRYLIVLDDVWNKYMAYNLNPSIQSRTKEFKLPFPDEENGSQVLLTTRLKQVNTVNDQFRCEVLRMRLLNQEESWELLREKVFAKEFCPPLLEEVGRKIAKKCEGLPLTIVAVADLLTKLEKTLLHWNEVAEQKNHQIFMAAYEKISKVLHRSYEHLPLVLKMCFLYMGIFPQTYEISRSKLITMWNIDGFLEQNELQIPSLTAKKCLEELISNSLVMIIQYTLFSTVIVEGEKKMKTCKLHSSMWYLSNREAKKTKFSHILDVLDDGLEDVVRNQCRLSFHNNVLLGIKDFHKSVEENCASTAQSLLCYGPYHKYQVPLCFGLGMLRLLDALTIRLYEFPTEVQKLIELRYLALTLNGKLPSSISLLSNLEFLIINRHMSIKTSRSASYLPAEIWNLQNLQHLEVVGNDLPDPPPGISLENLLKLKEVSAQSCTKGILEAIPKLKKLGIQIELVPGEPVSCFCPMAHLALKSLTCVILNPMDVPKIEPFPSFPFYLQKLSLNGMGYPWKEMSKIASLPQLKLLKLRNYAFRGPIWEVEENGFSSLFNLVIEDTDMMEWKIRKRSFRLLGYLSMKHCYKFEKIDWEYSILPRVIELVDCNPSGVKKMEHLAHERVAVHSSWNDGEL